VFTVVLPALLYNKSTSIGVVTPAAGGTSKVTVIFPAASIAAEPKEAGFNTAEEGVVLGATIGCFVKGFTPVSNNLDKE